MTFKRGDRIIVTIDGFSESFGTFQRVDEDDARLCAVILDTYRREYFFYLTDIQLLSEFYTASDREFDLQPLE